MEKIVVTPLEVRGYGNVVGDKTKNDLELYESYVSTYKDIIDNISLGVIRMVYMDPNLFFSFHLIEKYLYVNSDDVELSFEDKALVLEGTGFEIGFDSDTKELWVDELQTTLAIELSSNYSSVTVGSNVILSAIVTDDGVPVSGVSVSFKMGSTVIGSGNTNSSGKATFTYAPATAGVKSFTADYDVATSNSVNVTVNRKTATATLAASSGSIIVGSSVILTATVKYSSTSLNGIPVTFYEGSTVVGTGTTNSSGKATCTLSDLSVGSYSFTVVSGETDVYSSATSSSVSVVVSDHSYSLAFSQASYVASGGSATLECTLLDNSVPVSGATVSVVGSDSSVYTGLTNSNGVASVTVTNVTGTVSFTCTYSNVSDTCTVTGSSYLFYDECTSADGLSQYGTMHKLRVNAVDGTLSYDSGMNAYKWTPTTANADGFCDIPIPALDNKNNYYVECEIYTTDTTTGGQPGISIYPTSDTGGNGVFFRDIASINRCGVLEFANWAESGESGNSQKSSLPVGNNWIRIRIEVNNTSVKGIWLKTDGTEIYNHTYTVPYTSSQMRVGITALLKSTTKPYYIRNVKAEAL